MLEWLSLVLLVPFGIGMCDGLVCWLFSDSVSDTVGGVAGSLYAESVLFVQFDVLLSWGVIAGLVK